MSGTGDRGGPFRARYGQLLVRLVPFLWLFVFFAVPCLLVFRISLSEAVTAMPPYRPVIDWSAGFAGIRQAVGGLSFDNFALLLEDDLYWRSALSSFVFASAATVLLLLLGYPLAYAIARQPKGTRDILTLLIILPFWTSFLIRVYAWIGILKPEGLLNAMLLWAGVISTPLSLLNTDTAVLIGLVYSYLPFMVLPLCATLGKLDTTLLEAAQDLGASPMGAFWRITVPLSLPGVIAGSLLCFIPMMGEFVIPDLLGGSDTLMIGKTLWTEFFGNRDWPLASAVAMVLLLLLVGPIIAFREFEARQLEREGSAPSSKA